MKEKIDLSGQDKVKVYPSTVSDNPKVSVCITAFMHEKFIRKCLDSVLNQKTNFDFEILIGEDNSPDRTREVCVEYAEKYPSKVRLFLHDRSNVISLNNRPTGRYNFVYNMIHANGEYIALLDGDDYWTDPLKLQQQVNFLDNHNSYSVCTHLIERLTNNVLESVEERWHSKKNEFNIYDQIFSRFFHTSSIMYRNIGVPQEILNPQIITGDQFLFLIAINSGKVKVIEESMSVYRVHSGGITKSKNNQDKIIRYKSSLQVLDSFNEVSNFQYNDALELKKKLLKAQFDWLSSTSLIKRIKHRCSVLFITIKYFREFLGYNYVTSLKMIVEKMVANK